VFPVDAPPTNAYIVARDRSNDLAILKTSHEPTVVPALRRQVRTGESISVFGFPLSGLLSTSGNFTTGIVTAQTGIADDTRFVQISAPVQPGNSGGPLIDKYGNVVGVIVSKLNALNVAAATKDIPQNVNFAIKSSIAINFMESNAVSPNAAAKSFELPPEAIADLAKLFTVQISCD
jgi:S1-C subfamily serine protease